PPGRIGNGAGHAGGGCAALRCHPSGQEQSSDEQQDPDGRVDPQGATARMPHVSLLKRSIRHGSEDYMSAVTRAASRDATSDVRYRAERFGRGRLQADHPMSVSPAVHDVWLKPDTTEIPTRNHRWRPAL